VEFRRCGVIRGEHLRVVTKPEGQRASVLSFAAWNVQAGHSPIRNDNTLARCPSGLVTTANVRPRMTPHRLNSTRYSLSPSSPP